jgi:hypothetical protein
MLPKAANTVRIFFQNVKGLTYSTNGEDYEYYFHNLHQMQVDIAGLSETNTPWQLHHIRCEFLQRARKYSTITKTIFGSVDPDVDSALDKDQYQAGGCLMMIQGKWATTVNQQTISDNNRAISMITGYCTCKGSIQTAGIGTTFHREYEYYRDKGCKSPKPRQLFFLELANSIRKLQQQGHAMLIMMDANDVLSEKGEFAEWISALDLHDIHRQSPAPSTYIGSTSRRIDYYMLGCSQMIEFIKASGTLLYLEGPQLDHRGLYVDIDLAGYLHYDVENNKYLPAIARTLRTGNPELVSKYNNGMLRYYGDHNMEDRMESLIITIRLCHQKPYGKHWNHGTAIKDEQ